MAKEVNTKSMVSPEYLFRKALGWHQLQPLYISGSLFLLRLCLKNSKKIKQIP